MSRGSEFPYFLFPLPPPAPAIATKLSLTPKRSTLEHTASVGKRHTLVNRPSTPWSIRASDTDASDDSESYSSDSDFVLRDFPISPRKSRRPRKPLPSPIPRDVDEMEFTDSPPPRRPARKAKAKLEHIPCAAEGCHKVFTRITDMKRHMTTVHDGGRFSCDCGRNYSRPDALARHQKHPSCPVRARSGNPPQRQICNKDRQRRD